MMANVMHGENNSHLSLNPFPHGGEGDRKGEDRADLTSGLLTRTELAQVLQLSLRTVDRMVADEEITAVRLRGRLVRFHLPDVLEELRLRAVVSKRNCTRRI